MASLYAYLKVTNQGNIFKNWRPISLLSVVYKIATSCIAERMRKLLPTLMSKDQACFMANRYIGKNTRLI